MSICTVSVLARRGNNTTLNVSSAQAFFVLHRVVRLSQWSQVAVVVDEDVLPSHEVRVPLHTAEAVEVGKHVL